MMKETVSELYRMYDLFNTNVFMDKLPKVVITTETQGRKNAYGWFTVHKPWRDKEGNEYHEINISAEYLDRQVEDIMTTLLHEMVHLCNKVDGVNDCSKSGKHNKAFKSCAEEHGLICVENDKKLGWSKCALCDDIKEIICNAKISNEAFTLHKVEKEIPVRQQARKPIYTCSECGIKFKVTAKEELDLICGKCNQKIEVIEEE